MAVKKWPVIRYKHLINHNCVVVFYYRHFNWFFNSETPFYILNLGLLVANIVLFIIVLKNLKLTWLSSSAFVFSKFVVVFNRYEQAFELLLWKIILIVLFVRTSFTYVIVAVWLSRFLVLLFENFIINFFNLLILPCRNQLMSWVLFFFRRLYTRFGLLLILLHSYRLLFRLLSILFNFLSEQHVLNVLINSSSNTIAHL
jgi:hypothetical protein